MSKEKVNRRKKNPQGNFNTFGFKCSEWNWSEERLFWDGESKAVLLLFLLTKKLFFLTYQDKDILAMETCLLVYPGSNDKAHLFTEVITARAGNLSLYIFQNYHENIFSESDFSKDRSLGLILMYAVNINTWALSGTDLSLNQNTDK